MTDLTDRAIAAAFTDVAREFETSGAQRDPQLAAFIEAVEARAAQYAVRPADDSLDAALRERRDRPHTDIETGNARALFDKAKASRTQEVTISAQQLRVLLPAIEIEAETQTLRALAAKLGEGEG